MIQYPTVLLSTHTCNYVSFTRLQFNSCHNEAFNFVLRRCYMSAACLTCDLELSSNHDPRSIQSRGRRIALLSSYDQVCLLDNLKWEGSQCEKKLQTKGRREVERERQRKGEKEGGEEVRQRVREEASQLLHGKTATGDSIHQEPDC